MMKMVGSAGVLAECDEDADVDAGCVGCVATGVGSVRQSLFFDFGVLLLFYSIIIIKNIKNIKNINISIKQKEKKKKKRTQRVKEQEEEQDEKHKEEE